MNQASAIFPTPFAAWSRRVALFGLQLVLAGLFLHRFLSLSTPIAVNLFAAAFGFAIVAILLALVAFAVIWRVGRSGAWSAAGGMFLSLMLLAWPAAYLPFYLSLPEINDITTDTAVPPRFVALASQRAKDANRPEYKGQQVARIQAEAYPDIRPVVIPRPINETFDMVGDVVRRFRWQIVAEQAPQGRGKAGYIEALDRTLVLGFYDDIVIRVDGDHRESRIDVRSQSRYGRHDLGRNAARVRKLFAEIRTQFETGAPSGARRRRAKPGAAVPKRQKGAPQTAAGLSKQPGRSQSGAQRGQPPKEKQRPKAENRARDKQ